ncbi:DivIVA domain-containing protein [Micromonospora sp. NPDC000316]|uniref:DivIVA domain-containing protein n=1 Tax=Micromonospora sp. NPDC000316 TaxID=3364216 RepID=UPI0036B6103E
MAVYRSRHALTGPLTPDRIAALDLPRTRFGRRGYEPAHVDALLCRLAHELDRQGRHLDLVEAENHRIKDALRSWQTRATRIGQEQDRVGAIAERADTCEPSP